MKREGELRVKKVEYRGEVSEGERGYVRVWVGLEMNVSDVGGGEKWYGVGNMMIEMGRGDGSVLKLVVMVDEE